MEPAKRQTLVDAVLQSQSQSTTAWIKKSQAEFENELVFLFVEDMQPMATVDRDGFRHFCSIFLPRYTLPSRRTLNRRLGDLYEIEKVRFMAVLDKTKWVSATADIWSAHKRSFLGVTIHFVDPETLKMVSAVLTCRRFKGAHTGQAIGEMLASIFLEFNITSKIQNVVTDNAANFTKAFTLFGKFAATETDDNLPDDEDCANHIDVGNALQSLNENENDNEPIVLPPHKHCGNHSLNLVASTDSLAARQDKMYQKSYDRAMSKVQALSNAVSRSSKMNDIVEDITGRTFLKPTCTRWCSELYSVMRAVDIGYNKVAECQKQMGLNQMTQADMGFLVSYVGVMKPLEQAMKLLEGETDCYLGNLIPTIVTLEKKLQQNHDVQMKPLVDALLAGLKKRFGAIMNDKDYIIATILHPKFKMNYFSVEQRLEFRQLLLSFVLQVQSELSTLSGTISEGEGSVPVNDDSDFYSVIIDSEETNNAAAAVQDQVAGYFSSRSNSVDALLAYPALVEAFKKSNSTLPSSATVERLFSAAAQILTVRRCNLSDDNFDKLVFMRSMHKQMFKKQ